MRPLYTLVLLATLAGPAAAQRLDEQVPYRALELAVDGPPSIAARIYNYTPDLPLAYWPADTSGTFYIMPSLFERVEANGDTVGAGTPIVGAGVTAPGTVGLDSTNVRYDGLSEGCSPGDIENVGDFAGKIALIARGTCTFVTKFQVAQAAGAVGIVVYQPECHWATRAADAVGGPDEPESRLCSNPNILGIYMNGWLPAGEPDVGIPGVIVPSGIAYPIIDELLDGEAVTLTIRDRRSVTASDGPSPAATAVALAVTGPNPFRASTDLLVTTGQAETVRVEVLDTQGRRVATLLDGTVVGDRAVAFDASGLSPGVYVVRATGETFRAERRVTVAR